METNTESNNSVSGKQVKRVIFNDDNTRIMTCSPGSADLMYIIVNCGEYETHWVTYTRYGQEVARYNVKYLRAIEWLF